MFNVVSVVFDLPIKKDIILLQIGNFLWQSCDIERRTDPLTPSFCFVGATPLRDIRETQPCLHYMESQVVQLILRFSKYWSDLEMSLGSRLNR